MKKFTTQETAKLLESAPAFFKGIRLNYGSFRTAGKELGISPALLEKYSNAERGRKISDREIVRVQKAINKMPQAKRTTSLNFIIAHGNATPAQVRFMQEYAKKGEKQRGYIRKSINDSAGKNKRVLMPALTAGGKITNSPSTKRTTPEGSQEFTKAELKRFTAYAKKEAARIKREREKENNRAIRRVGRRSNKR